MSFEYPDPVDGGEVLSRFLLEDKKFAATKGRVKFRAFLPSPASFSVSVYRTGELSDEATWRIGHDYVADPMGKPLLARGDFPASVPGELGLALEPTQEPHPRHVNMTGISGGWAFEE